MSEFEALLDDLDFVAQSGGSEKLRQDVSEAKRLRQEQGLRKAVDEVGDLVKTLPTPRVDQRARVAAIREKATLLIKAGQLSASDAARLEARLHRLPL
jgi:hypothetical protein